MNGARKFKSLRLVRFGDILYDQQKRLIMLCRSCQRHYLSLEAFQLHLKKCLGIKHIVSSIDELQFDEEKRETRLVNGKQELLIYDPDAVRSSNSCHIDWEAELEDPRWYIDEVKTKQTQANANAKENMARARTRSQVTKNLECKEEIQLELPHLPAKRLRHSTPQKRTILTSQQQLKSRAALNLPTSSVKMKSERNVVNNVEANVGKLDVRTAAHTEQPATFTIPTTTLRTAPARPTAAIPMVTIPATNVSTGGDTQKILNKLRACGVEVKRRNTRETVESVRDAAALSKKQQALDIMRKLQSNGIRCTKVNNFKQ